MCEASNFTFQHGNDAKSTPEDASLSRNQLKIPPRFLNMNVIEKSVQKQPIESKGHLEDESLPQRDNDFAQHSPIGDKGAGKAAISVQQVASHRSFTSGRSRKSTEGQLWKRLFPQPNF
ncbi:hypothetical protein TNIN_91581 [Trichonephila inaurata madagascariensis]|uniref:Uncharacterized protein n=1 Tax=Trichonephila inaurata madagascariensis TaxID=2747483 RepID=A0A8X6XUP4_9ARAC|nr:hypothetical protein TNIN_91581 [Trichonephila inaurata madagascariensis]